MKSADTAVLKIWYCGIVPLLCSGFVMILLRRPFMFMSVYKLLITWHIAKNPVT